MLINLFGIWLLSSDVLYLKPLDIGCEIVTDQKNTKYTTAMDCMVVGMEFNEQVENGKN